MRGVNSARSLGHAEGSASAMLRDDATGAGGIAGWAGRTDKGKKEKMGATERDANMGFGIFP